MKAKWLNRYDEETKQIEQFYPITHAKAVIYGDDGDITFEDFGAALSSQLSDTFTNVDLLKKALTLSRGIYYFKSTCTNRPTTDNSDYHVIVSTRANGESNPAIKLIAYGYDSEAVYYNTYNPETKVWSGWTTHFLPLSGGTLTGDLTINDADGLYINRELNSALYRMQAYVGNVEGGAIGLQMTKDGAASGGFFTNGKFARIVDGETNKNYNLFGEHNTVPVKNGGTGVVSITSGNALIGNGTGAIKSRAITNNTSNTATLTRNTNLVTANTVSYFLNRTSALASDNTGYTTYCARAIALTNSVPTSITNGTIAFVYA